MAPPYLSVFYLVVPPFAVPVVLRNGSRSIYTPVPLLALLALVSGGFGLIENPPVQAVLQTLLAAIPGGSVLHLQGLANAPVSMLATTALLLICATLLSFSPRLSQVSPILFLISIVTTLSTTVLLFLARRRTSSSVTPTSNPVLPSPTPSHASFQHADPEIKQPEFASLRSPSEPDLDLSRRYSSLQQRAFPAPSGKTDLFLILSVQLSYIIAMSFCIPTALRAPAASTTLVSLFATSGHVSISTYVFHIVDIVFRIIALLLLFIAYYNCSAQLASRGIRPASPSISNAPTIPRRPTTRIFSPSTSPTPRRFDSLILPSAPTATLISPIKLNFFRPKHKRDGLSASSSFFSPYPKRTPFKRTLLAPTSDPEYEPEIFRRFPYGIKEISPSPSSSTTCIASNPIVPAPDTKEHSMIDDTFPFPSTACDPVLVRAATPMPVLCRERAWSWAHSAHVAKNQRGRDERNVAFGDEDCTDLTDPFASGPPRATVAPSAYGRWAESVEGSRRWSEHEIYPLTRMSTWGHLPFHQQRQGRTEPSKRIDSTVCAPT